MKKTKFHRLLALVLAFSFLIGGALTVNAATEGMEGSTTNKTLAEIKEQLNAISYEEYMANYAEVQRAIQSVMILGTDFTSFEKGATGEEARVVTDANGVSAVYTPGTGTTSWEVEIPETGKYSIIIEYWPDEAKSASIERILKINDKIPFAEARYLTLPKIWKNAYVCAQVTDPSGKVSLQTLYEEALAAGFAADSVQLVNNAKGAYVEVKIPDVWTQSMTEYVNKRTVRFMTSDIDSNELRPTMQQAPEWRTYEFRDADGFYAESFEFVFEAGKQTLSLEAVNEPMTIKTITLVPHQDMINYDEYIGRYEGVASGSDKITIQAEYVGATSSQNIYPVEDRTDAATMPADTDRVVLNTVGGEKWQTAGQWVRYSFTVNTSGMYNIAARYRQNVLDGMYVCRALYITSHGAEQGSLGYYGGKVPFVEATQLRFNYNTQWQSTLLNNGTTTEAGEPLAYEFYFEQGVVYTIEMEVTLGSMGGIVREVDAILDAVNNDYLAIMKLTGASPDEYRDYQFFTVMPDTMIDMLNQSEALYDVAARLAAITGEKSSNVATLEKVAWLLDRMGGNEDEVAKYLDQLKSYIGTLGTWLSDAKTQPLQLDYIVIQGADCKELPVAKAGFFASIAHEVKSFFMSFFRNYDRMGATSEDVEGDEVVDVWLAYGRDQAQVIRNLINNDFTPQTGITVNLKLVAGGTLLPSVLAGMGPDVYIGIGDDSVINYAIRGALVPVEHMDGFADFALEYMVDEHFNTIYDENGDPIKNPNSQFNEAAMLVLGIADADDVFHYYGLPETQNFTMMFIRDDILADLGIEIPRTWDDILAAIPVLQANNMQIGMHTDYKIFLYQNGGELFADDGMRINLDSNVGLESFETMCNFFTMYSFPYKYDFANRFRTGEMPIGFASYNGTYNHLTVFATEIKGLWEFLPMPGIEQTRADGSSYINNVSVSSVSAICMMAGGGLELENDTPEADARRARAWEFMKWHAGADCQIKYSNEMVAIIGPSAKHATANIQALREMPWTSAEYEQLSYQFNNLASIPNYPGSYIIGRYTSFAFLAAYEDNADPITELQSYISTINKEITRKREEFGLETLELGQTLTEKRLLQVEQAYENDTERMDEGKISAAAQALDVMKNGIKDEDAVALRKAAELFAAVDAEAFKATITALGNAATVLER
ncbi:MAG: extracellular solute-binding protein [Clostridia bacterium]|nr:extracellular solute-binding protein [Clostridia bacterium]